MPATRPGNRRWNPMQVLAAVVLAEVRDALRRLLRRPAPAGLAVLVLGGGMACFLFTLVLLRGIVMASPPYADIDRLVNLSYAQAGKPTLRMGIPADETADLLARLDNLEKVAEYSRATVVLRHDEVPHPLQGLFVGSAFFETLGLAPLLGRTLGVGDMAATAPTAALLTDAVWRSRFAADPAVLGRSIEVDGRAATVIGVLPASFDFNDAQIVLAAQRGAPWTRTHTYMLVGRLAEGRSLVQLSDQLQAYVAALPAERRGEGASALLPRASSLKRWVVGVDTGYFIGLMVLSASLVLIMAVANVAHLQVAGMATRLRELATRAVLGSSHRRLVGGLLLDAALVTVAATALALLLADLAGLWLAETVAAAGDPMRPWMNTRVDATVLAWSLLTALGVSALSALGAVWRVRSLQVEATLRGGGAVGVDLAAGRGAAVMTVVQIALACILLLTALVSVRLLAAVLTVEPGTRADPARVLTARVALPAGTGPAEALRRAEAIRERLAREPGVESVSLSSAVPGRGLPRLSFQVEGSRNGGSDAFSSAVAHIDAHFAATLDFDVIGGRGFSDDDVLQGRPVALVDQAFVDTFLGGGDPIGRRLLLEPGSASAREVTIVGRTAALHPWTPDDLPSPDLLLPFAAQQDRFFALVLRSAQPPEALAARLPTLVAEVDADAPLHAVLTQEAVANMERMGIALLTRIFASIASVGLLLSAAGIYATLALGVARRTREIGLRRAIGASQRNVLFSVTRGGGVSVLAGMLLGCLLGGPLAYGMATQMQHAAGFDGLLFLTVLGTLGLAAALAMLIPVRRALRIAPMEALRHE